MIEIYANDNYLQLSNSSATSLDFVSLVAVISIITFIVELVQDNGKALRIIARDLAIENMGCATSASAILSSNNNRDSASINGQQLTVRPLPTTTWDDDPYADKDIVLDAQQKRIVARQWRIVSNDIRGRGSRIFQLMFARNPRFRALFTFGHLEGEKLLNDQRFKDHSLRFMEAVGYVIDHFEDYSETSKPLFNQLGRQHVSFKGFKPIYFNDFQESIMQAGVVL